MTRKRLSLYRKPGERVVLRNGGGKLIGTIQVSKVDGDRAILCFELPDEVRVFREEIEPTTKPVGCDGCGAGAKREKHRGLYLCGMCLLAAVKEPRR